MENVPKVSKLASHQLDTSFPSSIRNDEPDEEEIITAQLPNCQMKFIYLPFR
jgi:hypothetical protein